MSSNLLQFALKKGQNPGSDVSSNLNGSTSSSEDEMNKRLEDELGFLPPEEVTSVMKQPKEDPLKSNQVSPPKLINPTISSVQPTMFNYSMPNLYQNGNLSYSAPLHSTPSPYQNGNLNYKTNLLPLPSNLQMLNTSHFLDPKNQVMQSNTAVYTNSAAQSNPASQSTPTAHTTSATTANSYFPANSIPKPDPKPIEETKPEKEDYRGKSRYRVNPNGKTYDCQECGAQLKAKASLDLHVKSKHMHVKDFKCPFCEYKSAQKGAIGGHMAAAHNKTEKFECNECKKMLDGKREATHHAKEHRGFPSGFDNQFTRIVTFIEP